MKRKLTLHRDTVRNLDGVDAVQGARPTALPFGCPSLVATCKVGCTLSPTVCVPAACTF